MAGTLFAPTWDASLADENVQAGLYACLGIFGVISVASTVFRFIVKHRYQVKFGKDDAAILASTVLNFLVNIFQLLAILYGLGRHTQFLDLDDVTRSNKYLQIIIPVGCIANIATKLSLGFLSNKYIRHTSFKFLYRTTNITMIVTVILGLLCVILWATQNVPHPLSKIWDPIRSPGPFPNVWKYLGIIYAIGGLGIATDLIYSLSPLYVLRRKLPPSSSGISDDSEHRRASIPQLRKSDRVFIQALMGCGLIVSVVSIVSLTYAMRYLWLVDMTWILVPRYTCDMIERNLAVVVANAPSVKIMFAQRRRLRYPSGYRCSKHMYNSHSHGSDHTSATRVDSEGGPGTWFAKENIGPATMEVAVVGGRTNASNSIELPIEGETTRGLKIMKSVDIVTEWSGPVDGATALPEVPEPPEPVALMDGERRGSHSSVNRPRGPSRNHSTTSLNSNRTGRYSLYPVAQTSPVPDSLIPRLM